MKVRKTHKHLGGSLPFPGHHRIDSGKPATHLKPSRVKRARTSHAVNALVSTDLVQGPGKATKGHKAGTSRKRTITKA